MWSRSRGHSACSQGFLHMLSVSQSAWMPILKPYVLAKPCFPKCMVCTVPYYMHLNLFLLSTQREHIVSWEMRLSWPRQCGEHLDPAHRKLPTSSSILSLPWLFCRPCVPDGVAIGGRRALGLTFHRDMNVTTFQCMRWLFPWDSLSFHDCPNVC